MSIQPPMTIKSFFTTKCKGIYNFYIIAPKDSDDIFFETKLHWLNKKKYKCYGDKCERCENGIESSTETYFLMYITDSNDALHPKGLYCAVTNPKFTLILIEAMQTGEWEYNKKIQLDLTKNVEVFIQETADEILPTLDGIQIPRKNDIVQKQIRALTA
jgi:hypothetical protein